MNKELVEVWSDSIAGVVVEFLSEKWSTTSADIYIKDVRFYVNNKRGPDGKAISIELTGNLLTSKKTGWIIREQLGFKTKRTSKGYIVLKDNRLLEELKIKYGVQDIETPESS